jgi:hypothetical protein
MWVRIDLSIAVLYDYTLSNLWMINTAGGSTEGEEEQVRRGKMWVRML